MKSDLIPMQGEHESSEDEEAAQRPTSFLGFWF